MITWTESEIEFLAEKLTNAYMLHPGKSLIQMINSLQKMMPPDRRRKILQLAQIVSIVTKMKERLLVIRDRADNRPLTLNEVLHLLSEKVTAIENRLEYLENKEKLREPVPCGNGIPRENLETLLQKPKKIKIGVIGLLAIQYQEVEKHFMNDPRIKLRYVKRNEYKAQLPSTLDKVIICKDFIMHAIQNQVYAEYERDKVHVIKGAATSVIDEIEAILELSAVK